MNQIFTLAMLANFEPSFCDQKNALVDVKGMYLTDTSLAADEDPFDLLLRIRHGAFTATRGDFHL